MYRNITNALPWKSLFLCMLLTFGWSGGTARAEWEECIGKTYGIPGCPVIEQEDADVIPPLCGDGIVHADEECDLGRFNGLTNCTEECKILYCGDAIVSPYLGEECEPLREEYYALDASTGGLIREVRYVVQTCGGICEPPVCNETGQCFGGCKRKFLPECTATQQTVPSTVRVTVQSASSSPKTVTPVSSVSSLPATDTIEAHQAGSEQSQPDTGEQSGASLPPVSSSSVAAESVQPATIARCGDGKVEGEEQCDDGNYANFDACPNTCRFSVCGDGIREGTEECDDGNDDSTDYCNADCRLTMCGDGTLQKYEECDAGRSNSNSEPNTCRLNCVLPWCGDGVQDRDEVCDDGNADNNDGCTILCGPPACGDGFEQDGEECDDGGGNSDEEASACRLDCTLPFCGDGVTDEGEECDDGNSNEEDDCSNVCKHTKCGDGIVQKAEECDDGNDNEADACNHHCTKTFCGDGILQDGEECDDGNTLNEDSCTTACKLPVCGDSYVQSGEECDAGAANSNGEADACRSDCRNASCGDGTVDTGEECDGGERCTEDCREKTLALFVSRNKALSGGVATVLVTGTLLPGLIYVRKFRKKRWGKSAPKAEATSLDEIPLSQFELPWHSWSRK